MRAQLFTGCVCFWLRTLVGLGMALGTGSGHAAESVQALRYGVTLYHFYQQDYFASLTELMAAQELEQLGVHTGNAELLRGGMSLSYGMDRVAEQVFLDLLVDLPASPENPAIDPDRPWFYLAKLAWRRGDLERAGSALDQISHEYRGPLAEEADYLRASIGLRDGDEALALNYAEGSLANTLWSSYLYYNLGASRATWGDWSGATKFFRRLEVPPVRTTESKVLADKAYAAAGFAWMAAEDWERAAQEFTHVRLDSPLSDRALLGYGWTYSERGDFRSALSPWQTLSERSPMTESVRESLLAVPYAYEKLGKHSLALDHYRHASQKYAQELAEVQTAIALFSSANLPELLGLGGDVTGEWLGGADILPELPYLGHLISRHSMQLALRELRDLHHIALQLSDADQRLQVLARVDADQQHSWVTVTEGGRRHILEQRQAALLSRIDRLREQFESARNSEDSRWFADGVQAARWQRLIRVVELAAELSIEETHTDQIDLYRGLLLWDDSENYSARAWQANRQLRELETLAQESSVQLEAVDRAIASRQQLVFEPRIRSLERRLVQHVTRTQSAIHGAEQGIRRVALIELEARSQQVLRSLGQSQLAIARLYDLGSEELLP